MFQEVKEHNGFADAEQGLMDEICAEAEAKAAAAAPAPAPATAAPRAGRPPTATGRRATDAGRARDRAVTWRPGPEALWKRALPSVVVAYGGPVIHNTIDAARAQLKGDKDGRRIWGVDLPPPDSGGAPKRWFVATPAEVDEGYARLHPQDRHVYEVIDARRPCWAYFDLEFTRKDGLNAAVDGDALTERVVSAACDALVAAAGDRPLEIEVIVLASARPTKFSRHVVLRPHWTDGTRRPAPLAGSPHAGHLADVVIKALGDALTVQSGDARTTTSFVDTGVYTRDRCFRVWGSTKHGDDEAAAFDVTEQRVFPGSRPVAFTRSPLRETLVVPELQPGEIDCLEIEAPVEPPPPPPSPGAAEEAAAPAAPAAPAPAGSWEDSWDGATATPCSTRRRSPTSSSSRGRATEASRRRCSPRRRRGARGAPARPPRQRRPHADVLALRRGGIPVGTVPPPHRQGPGRLLSKPRPAAPEPEPRRDGRPGQRPLLAALLRRRRLRAQRAHDERRRLPPREPPRARRAGGRPQGRPRRAARVREGPLLVYTVATHEFLRRRALRLARARSAAS